MENASPRDPWAYGTFPPREFPFFPTGKKELTFGACILACGLMLCNFILMGGFNLGFAIAAVICICCSGAYLRLAGCRGTAYSTTLLILGAVIAAGFVRSDDGFVKFVMFCFLLVAVNLGLCLMAGQNRRSAAGLASVLDVPRTGFIMGLDLSPAFRGLSRTLRGGSSMWRKGGAVLLGLLIAVPLLLILVPLLMSADAAFEGLLQLLPEFDLQEAIVTVLFGTGAACVLYTRSVALRHRPKQASAAPVIKRFISPLTVNTVLAAVCLVYVVYLFSQLAYFFGGFAGILPEEFTMAEYARRGFFEMAWICAIDLGIIALAVGLVTKQNGKAPLSTRLLCLFIGIVTVLLVSTASAKMFLYIDAYGLTRLRVLTEVIMVFLAVATAVVSVWLFLPKLPYMKVLLVVALCMGAAVLWADVDTVVASYNVSAYQSGKLDRVDLDYLADLGDGAIPQIYKLTDDSEPDVAKKAREILNEYDEYKEYRVGWNDIRGWNFVSWYAEGLIEEK